MRYILTTSLLILTGFVYAQDITVACPAGDTVACYEAIPDPSTAGVFVNTDCDIDWDGNPIDTNTTGGGGVSVSCDTAREGCFEAFAKTVTELADGSTSFTFQITYGDDGDCRHAVSHVAFSLPDGVAAIDFRENDTYAGQLGTYNVENTTKNPYHSIKFESNHDGFEPGETETFTFTLAAGVDYDDVDIRIKGGRIRNDLTVSTNCSDTTTTSAPADSNYIVRWLYDYTVPGGTGCLDDPILIQRVFGAEDACFGSSSCVQEYYIASECVNGVPVGCTADSIQGSGTLNRMTISSSTVYQSGQDMYAAQFAQATEDDSGYYSINKLITDGQRRGSSELQELARLAPNGKEMYAFGHESIGRSDSIVVQWVGANTVSNTQTAQELSISSLRVYPNPGNDYFEVELQQHLERSAKVEVFDAFGRVVSYQLVSAGTNLIDIQSGNWPSGFYSVRIVELNGQLHHGVWQKR